MLAASSNASLGCVHILIHNTGVFHTLTFPPVCQINPAINTVQSNEKGNTNRIYPKLYSFFCGVIIFLLVYIFQQSNIEIMDITS